MSAKLQTASTSGDFIPRPPITGFSTRLPPLTPFVIPQIKILSGTTVALSVSRANWVSVNMLVCSQNAPCRRWLWRGAVCLKTRKHHTIRGRESSKTYTWTRFILRVQHSIYWVQYGASVQVTGKLWIFTSLNTQSQPITPLKAE